MVFAFWVTEGCGFESRIRIVSRPWEKGVFRKMRLSGQRNRNFGKQLIILMLGILQSESKSSLSSRSDDSRTKYPKLSKRGEIERNDRAKATITYIAKYRPNQLVGRGVKAGQRVALVEGWLIALKFDSNPPADWDGFCRWEQG